MNIINIIWKKPGELWIGNTKITALPDGSYTAEPGTVPEQTLNCIRNMFTGIHYAYINSTVVPADEIEIDAESLPEGITQDQLTYNTATDTWHASMDIHPGRF